jgi:hypothetical protein
MRVQNLAYRPSRLSYSRDDIDLVHRSSSLPDAERPRYEAGKYSSTATLKWINVAAIVLHVVSGALGSAASADLHQSAPAVAPLFRFVSNDPTQYIAAKPQVVFTVGLLWPSVAVEFITAFFHVVYLCMLWWPRGVLRVFSSPNSANTLRWVEYGITASLMSAFGLLIVGANDFYLFLKILTNGVALQAIGYCIELLNCNRAEDVRLFNVLWWVVGFNLNIINVFILLYQAFASDLGSALHIYYENIVPFFFWFQTFGVVASLAFWRWRQFADPNFCEKYYLLLSLSTKIAVFWLGFGSFRKILEDNGSVSHAGVNWDAVRYCAMVLPASVLVVSAWYDATSWSFLKRKVDEPVMERVSDFHSRTMSSAIYQSGVNVIAREPLQRRY